MNIGDIIPWQAWFVAGGYFVLQYFQNQGNAAQAAADRDASDRRIGRTQDCVRDLAQMGLARMQAVTSQDQSGMPGGGLTNRHQGVAFPGTQMANWAPPQPNPMNLGGGGPGGGPPPVAVGGPPPAVPPVVPPAAPPVPPAVPPVAPPVVPPAGPGAVPPAAPPVAPGAAPPVAPVVPPAGPPPAAPAPAAVAPGRAGGFRRVVP